MCLSSITKETYRPGSYSKTLNFTSQYDTSIPEDQRFQKATPSASAKFVVDNPAALEQFVPGECYYLDFTPVPKS
jgi:hypothetical protein